MAGRNWDNIQLYKDISIKLNCKRSIVNQYCLMNAVKLLKCQNDITRIKGLLKLYLIQAEFMSGDRICNFYNWYKFNRLSKKDVLIYEWYCDVCQQLGHTEPVLPTAFSGVEYNLYSRIIKWISDGGNSIKKVMMIYFKVVIDKAFNRGLVYRPKSLLGEYGWGLFMEYIDSLGGKDNFIMPAKSKVKEANTIRDKLIKFSVFKNKLIRSGNNEDADYLEKELYALGIDKFYEEYLK